MADKYWWEKNDKKTTTQSATKSNNQTEKKYWWEKNTTKSDGVSEDKSYWWENGTAAKAVSNTIVHRVNDWLKNHNSYISDYQNRTSERKYNLEDSYVSDSAEWLESATKRKNDSYAEAQSIMSYIEENKNYLDSGWAKDVRALLARAKIDQSNILDFYTKDNEYWQGFKNETEYGYAQRYAGKTSTELKNLAAVRGDDAEKEWLTSYADSVAYNEKLNFDTVAGEQEVADLEAVYAEMKGFIENELRPIVGSSERYDEEVVNAAYDRYLKFQDQYGDLRQLENLIREKKGYLEDAQHTQKYVTMSGVSDQNSKYYDPDFEKYAEIGATADYVAYTKEHQQNNSGTNKSYNAAIVALAEHYDQPVVVYYNDQASVDRYKKYMNDEEFKTLAYYVAKDQEQGTNLAEQYIDSLEELLTQREANTAYSIINLVDHYLPGVKYLYGVYAGLDQFVSGIDSLVPNKENHASSVTQAVSGMIREDLGDAGIPYFNFASGKWETWNPSIFGSSIGQIGYDLITTTSNMVPSILASTAVGLVNPAAGAAVGSGLMGLSSAGHAYQEAINLGYDNGQARLYSALVGASEAGLQYLMGGIGKLGGKITGKAAVNLASKFDSALARVAVQYGTNMISEGAEEYLQEVLTPLFKNIALKTDEEINLISEDAIYSFVLGALSSGVMEGGSFAGNIADVSSKNQANIDATKLYGGSTAELIAEGLTSPVGSESYQNADIAKRKMDKGKVVSGYEIRQMVDSNSKQIASEITPEAKSRLKELGETKDIDNIASLVAKKVSGQALTRAEISTLARSQYGAQVAKEMSGIETDTKEEKVAYKPLEERVGNEAKFNVSDSGKATIHGTDNAISLDKVEVTEFVKDESGKVTDMVLKVDGKEVKASEIDYADDSQSHLFAAVSQIENITPADAQAIIRDYDPASGLSVGEYLNGIDEGFTYGYHNYSEADLKAGNYAPKLSDVQAKSAYVLGQNARKNRDTSREEAVVRMRTAVEAEAEKAKAEGKEAPKSKELTITVTNEKGETVTIDEADTTEGKQSGGIKVAQMLHKLGLGTNFKFFTSYLSETMKVKDKKTGKLVPARVFLDENGVEQLAPAGVYRMSDGMILIDMNAYNGKQLTLYALSHELTHFIQQWSTKKYKVLVDFLMQTYEDTSITMHQRVLREQARLKEIRGEEVSYNEAYDEVVANAMMKMFDDGKLVERLTELKVKDKKLAQKLWEGFKEILNKFLGIYQKEKALFRDADDLMKMKDAFEQLQNMFAEALVEASDNFQAAQTIGFEMDVETESVAPAVMHSEQTWSESDYVQQRDKAAQEIAKAIGVSEKKAKDYIDSVNSIAKMIAEDRSRLDYFSSPGRSSFVDNAEYGGSFDFSTLCKKRRLLTGTFTAIQKALPNTALTADEILDIRNRMKEKGLEVSCGLCYVEGSRANMGQFAKEFLRLYKQYYPDAWQPNMADVNTPDGIEWVRINHPECYEQYEYFWNHYGTLKDGDKNLFDSQQKPKLYQLHTEYKGEILNKFKNDDKVEDKNLNGGIRLQSFSDFEIVHLIDTMQIIMDMSRVGLAGQAYTKVPDFAWALGDTGLKINLSLIAKGVDENGKLIFDDVEGMPIAEAMKLRDRYSKNVGTILVAFNDAQLLAAMADDRVDFIIPFHRSQWKKSQYEAMGLPAKTKDYTFMQNEKFIKPTYHEYRGRMVKDKATNYMPNEYWDFSKSGKENAEAYLEMCARNNKRPKFYKFLQDNGDGSYSLKADGSTDGYWKLLIDFKMYDNDGVGSPQMAVKPEFNMEEATRMLNDYSGGHSNFPVAQGIVNEFVKDYKDSHKGQMYSSQETDLDADKEKVYSYEGLPADAFYNEDYSYIYSYDFLTAQKDMTVVDSLPTLQELQTEGKIDSAKVLDAGYKNVLKMGGTKVGDTYSIVNTYTNRPLQIGKNSITHGLGAEDINAKRTNARLAAVIGELCKNAIPICALPNTHNVRGTYGMAVLVNSRVNGKDMNMIALITVEQQNGNVQSVDFVDVAHAVSGRLVRDIEKENRSAQGTPPGTKSEWATRFSSTLKITQFLDIVNRTHQGYLSDDVISRLGEERRGPKKAMYSTQETDNISNRDLLANAFESISQNSEEYKLIQRYKNRIKILNELEEKLGKLNAEIRQIRFGKDGVKDMAKLQQLEAEAKNTAKLINAQDKKLLSLEASEPLRKVIEQERKKEAQKTKEHIKDIQQNRKVKAEQAEIRHKIRKAIRDLDKILNRGNKKQNVKEDMQGFVSKALELADFLFTDHISNEDLIRRGLDENLVAASGKAQLVKETEDILTQLYDNIGSLTAEEYAQLDAKRKKNMDKLRDLLTSQRNQLLSTPVYNLFDSLTTEYASLKNSNQDAVKAAYNAEVERFLRSYMGEENGNADSDRKALLQNMRVADMTTKELEHLYYAYKMVLHSVRDANKLWVKGKAESVEQVASAIMSDFSKRKTPNGTIDTVARNLANKIGWDYEKLYYALDRIGSDAFTELFMNLANSENIVMQDVIEAALFRDQMVEKYGHNDWAVNKEIDREFMDNTGKKFKMTLGQLMALYAYSRRENANDNIEFGGFVFGKAALTNPKPADSYKLSKKQCDAITSLLTAEQKAYAEDMQKYLSDVMGAKGNEVSMRMYGIKMFGEKNYFPVHIAGIFKPQAEEAQAKSAAGFTSMSNAGFTHAKNPNAKAPFVLEGFDEIWADHVNEMSRYHGTVPALEDIRRVMNRSAYSDSTADSVSIAQMMENSYGKEAREYFHNLYKEANSGAITDKLQHTSKKLLSLFRKNSVAYSLSVLIQQPTSLVRAYAMIDRKYFGVKGVGAITSGVARAISDKWTKAYTNAYNEMLKYAPGVTMAKEIGGFDTATGGSIRSYLLDSKKGFWKTMKSGTHMEKAKAHLDVVDNNFIANLPNTADKIAWIEIWNACKRETVATHKELTPNSEEFMKAVGDRFTEVIRATQVYDSIFAKSPTLKSKNLFVQMLVSFMNEPNTTINMAESAVRDFFRGDWKSGAKKAHVLIHSTIFASLMVSMIYAMRDDDEDETYIEKYIDALAGSLMDNFNPFNYIPIARDVVSLTQGYDVERTDMAIVADFLDAIEKVQKYNNTDTEGMTEKELIELEAKKTEANWNLVGSLAAFFGIPVKNIRREVSGVLDHARIAYANAGKTTATSAWDTIYDAVIDSLPDFLGLKTSTKTEKLYNAIVNGDKVYVERMKSTYVDKEGNFDPDKYDSAVRKALRENDSRIHEAALARYNGNTAEYKRIFNEIKNEGKFSFDDIMSAINSEVSKIKGELEPEKESSEYSATDFVNAILVGDTGTARAMRDSIISFKMSEGKTREEAEESFESSVSSSARNAFDSGLLNATGAKNLLMEYADMDEEDAVSRVDYWAFVKANPKYRDDLNEANVKDYREFAEPANISLDVFVQYLKNTKGLATIYDEWGDEVKSKRDQVLEVIDSLPLTWQQKDALYLAAGYSENNIWDVPW